MYPAWISDDLVEWHLLSGRLTLNRIDLEPGDYIGVPAAVEVSMHSEPGMEALCIMHGGVLRAVEVYPLISNMALADVDAAQLLALPWIDHLRRQIPADFADVLARVIVQTTSEALRELCVSMGRNVQSEALAKAVLAVSDRPANLSMRVSALLYLASKGLMSQQKWDDQRLALLSIPGELLRVLMSFYSAKTLPALKEAVEMRLASGSYEYNRPFYTLVLRELEASEGGAAATANIG